MGSAGHAAARPGAGRGEGLHPGALDVAGPVRKGALAGRLHPGPAGGAGHGRLEAGQGGAGGTPKGLPGGAPRAVPGGHQPHAGADFPAFRGAGHA